MPKFIYWNNDPNGIFINLHYVTKFIYRPKNGEIESTATVTLRGEQYPVILSDRAADDFLALVKVKYLA